MATLNSTTPPPAKSAINADLQSGHPRTRLLYVTPEYCLLESFRRTLHTIHTQRELSRIAIDEAHCISEWGHDFRPAYTHLSFFKQTFPDVPVMCLTATATPRVRDDVVRMLGLDQRTLKRFAMSTSRPNLHYEVRFKSDDQDHYRDFLSWIQAVHARRARNAVRAAELAKTGERADNVPGIIYTLYRRDCEALASRLTADGVGAKPFHAGLAARDKDDHLRGWVENRRGYDVMVATTAFGMGIDKDNVRFVAHWQLPKSFEGYYQESGRAGRDGRASACILYYAREDRDRAQFMMAKDLERKRNGGNGHHGGEGEPHLDPQTKHRAASLEALVGYCEATSRCRHEAIACYFGEDKGTARCDSACDRCKDAKALAARKERGLASEEWCSTQRDTGAYGGWDEYD